MSRLGVIAGATWSALAVAGTMAFFDVGWFIWMIERPVHPLLPLTAVLVYGVFGLSCGAVTGLLSQRLSSTGAAALSGAFTGFLLSCALLFLRVLPASIEILTPVGGGVGLLLAGLFSVAARPWGRFVTMRLRAVRWIVASLCVASVSWALLPHLRAPHRDGVSADSDAPGILLLVLDTLRADRLAAYGNTDDVMPNLDRFAQEGTIFTGSVSTSCHTPPPHASLLTGVYPRIHGVNDHQRRFSRQNETVPEMLREDRWHTFAVVANVQLQGFLGWDQGFEEYDESLIALYGVLDWSSRTPAILLARKLGLRAEGILVGSALRLGIFQRPVAASVVDRSLAALDGVGDRPFFGMVNFMDPHYPYTAPGSPPEAVQINRELRRALSSPGHTISSDEARAIADRVPDLYDGEVRYLDRELGRFFDALRERGLLERTWVIVTSDHGEHLGEHGRMLHSNSLFRELVDVPLLVRAPTGTDVPRIDSSPVSSVDVAATICDAAGLERPDSMQGRSLLEPNGADESRAVVSEWQGRRVLAFEGGRGFFENDEFVGAVAEGDDVGTVSDDPVLAQRARELYGVWVERHDRGGVAVDADDLDEALTRRLRALGYVE